MAAGDHACVDWLLNNTDLLKAANAQGRTALHEAAARADVELVKKLLAAGQDASQPDAAGETPLMLLASTPFELPPGPSTDERHRCSDRKRDVGDEEDWHCEDLRRKRRLTAGLLIEHGACRRESTTGAQSSLSRARLTGSQHIAEELFYDARRGCVPELEQKDSVWQTLRSLDQASSSTERAWALWQVVELVGKGASLTMTEREESEGLTALHVLAASSGRIELEWPAQLLQAVNVLHNRGIALDGEDRHHRRPLWYAVSAQGTAMVKELLDLGSDPEHVDDRGQTVLFRAAELPSRAMFDLLLANGADPKRKDPRGWTVIQAAEAAGNHELASWLRQNWGRLHEEENFYQSVRACHTDALRTFFKRNPRIDSTGIHVIGEPPICQAARHCSPVLVKELLDRVSKVDDKCDMDLLPVQAAGAEGRLDVVEFLCETYRYHSTYCGPPKPGYGRFTSPDVVVGVGRAFQTRDIDGFYGVRPSLLFKHSEASWGSGIYGEAVVRGASDVRLGGGVQVAAPFPVVPSLGAYLRPSTAGEWRPGLAVGVFVGYHAGGYKEAEPRITLRGDNVGVRIDVYKDLSGRRDTTLWVSVQIDLVTALQSLPIVAPG